jgi:hypothetical protein
MKGLVAAILLLPLLAFTAGGCTEMCNCGPGPGGTLALPATWSSPVTEISVAKPCYLNGEVLSHVDGEVSGNMIGIGASAPGMYACLVTVQLANGDVYTTSVSLAPGPSCCSSSSYIVGSTPFDQIDAGAVSPG